MKILYIINNLGSGGAEKLIEQALPLFKKRNIDVELLILTDKGNVFDKALINNQIKIKVVPIKSIRNPLNIFYIRQHIIRGDYDIVHVHLFPSLYWASLASKLIFKRKPKFVFTEHNTKNERMNLNFLRYLEKFIYSSFDEVISVSEATHSSIQNWLQFKNTSKNKFLVIRNGISIEELSKSLPYLKKDIVSNLQDDDKIICMAGRFSEQKDQPTVIRAIKNLPKNVHLLLVGEGELIKKNKDLAKELGISDRVHFLGFRSDIDRIFKTSDIIVFSSNWEGFGLVAIEGMAVSKPVIASNISGLRDIVDGAGILFEKGNDKELSEIIQNLLSNGSEYERVSRLCFKRSKMFDINKMVSEHEELYNSLINK